MKPQRYSLVRGSMEPATNGPWRKYDEELEGWASEKQEQSCKTCLFWQEGGFCRRYPPKMIQAKHPERLYPEPYWTETHKNDWCGEYKENNNGSV